MNIAASLGLQILDQVLNSDEESEVTDLGNNDGNTQMTNNFRARNYHLPVH